MNIEEKIQAMALVLALDLKEKNHFDVGEISTMIEVRLKMHLPDILKSVSEQEELKYLSFLREQQSLRIGSPRYNEVAFELSQLKVAKAQANRAANNVAKINKFELLKSFVIDKLGEGEFKAFKESLKNNITCKTI